MKIALFILLAIYLIVPITLFQLNNKRMANFCLFMATSHKCRKFFCYTLLLAVIYFHFVFYQSFKTEYGLMISSIVLVPMFSTRLTEQALLLLKQDSKKMFAFTAVTLFLAFMPHLLPLAITMAILLVGANFYPSARVIECQEEFLTGYYNQCLRDNDFRSFLRVYFN